MASIINVTFEALHTFIRSQIELIELVLLQAAQLGFHFYKEKTVMRHLLKGPVLRTHY